MRPEAIHAASKDRKEALRVLSVVAAAWMVHVRNRATLLNAGCGPERAERASQFVSNSRAMLTTSVARYLGTL